MLLARKQEEVQIVFSNGLSWEKYRKYKICFPTSVRCAEIASKSRMLLKRSKTPGLESTLNCTGPAPNFRSSILAKNFLRQGVTVSSLPIVKKPLPMGWPDERT